MSFPPPAVNAVTCFQQADRPTVEVSWDNTQYPVMQQFVVGIFDTSITTPITVSDPSFGSTGAVTASQPLNASRSYEIRVTTYDGTPGTWPANGPAALFLAPTNLVISYDGTNISAKWQNPTAGTMPPAGRVTISTGGGSYVFDVDGAGGTFVPTGVPLDPNTAATLTVSGELGVALGPPSGSVTLIQSQLPLTLIDNSGTNPRTIRLSGFTSGTQRTFDVLLSSGGTALQSFKGVQEDTSGNVSLTFANAPAAGVQYELAASLMNASSTGPLGPASSLVVAAPVVQSVAYSTSGANGLLAFDTVAPQGQPFVSGVQISVMKSGVTTAVTQQVAYTPAGVIQFTALDTSSNYTATFRSALGMAVGISLGPAAAQSPAVLTATPGVTALSYDGSVLKATWSPSAQSGMTAYQLEIISGGVPLVAGQFSGTTGALPLPAVANVSYSARVRTIGTGTSGPAGTPSSALLTRVVVTSATTDPINGKTTINWTAARGATTYTLQLYANGIPTGAAITGLTGTSYTTTNPIAAGESLSAALQVIAGAATGPFGARYTLPTAQPSNVGVAYNGATLTVSWTPAPGATAHTAYVYAQGASATLAKATAGANATSVTFAPFTVDPTKTYDVVVMANVRADSGPPTTSLPLFSSGFYPSGASATPYIAPSSSLAFAAQAITIHLPDIGGGTAISNLPITNSSFTLTTSSAPFSYALTIPATSKAWSWDSTSRAALLADYDSLLRSAETNHATPYGISVLQQAISRAMPQTFGETLFYAYGLDIGTNPSVDLRPGMLLRVVLNDYIDVGKTAPSPWINGYIGGSVLDYDISSYLSTSLAPAQQWTLGFDALLSQLVANGAITVQPPQMSVANRSESGIAEAIDLYWSYFRAPFYRLFFPPDLMSPSGIGTTFTESNFVLAAASSYQTLQSTVNYPTGSNPSVAYFRGRTIVKVCIRVFVNGGEIVVPVGTTVNNILERYGQQVPSAAVSFSRVQLDRATGFAVASASSVDAGATIPVRLDWNALSVYGPGHTALSLPLLHGDRLTIG